MNTLQFIASITSSLIWPVVIIIVVTLLKTSLSQTILSLEKLKLGYKENGIELSFRKELDKLEIAAEKANIPDNSQEINIPSERIKLSIKAEDDDKEIIQGKNTEDDDKEIIQGKNTEDKASVPNNQTTQEKSVKQTQAEILESKLQQISLEVEKQRLGLQRALQLLTTQKTQTRDEDIAIVTENGPIGAIVLAWSQVERELMALVSLLWAGTLPPSPTRAIIFFKDSIVRNNPNVDIEALRILSNLQLLRNRAVHINNEANITFADALEYVRLAKRMVTLLSSLKRSYQVIDLATIQPQELEELILELLSKIFEKKKSKFHISVISQNKISAFDIDPISGEKIIIEVKLYKPSTSVASKTIEQLYQNIITERATKGILITTSYFTSKAQTLAQNKPIQLIDRTELLHLFKQYGYNVKVEPQDNKDIQ